MDKRRFIKSLSALSFSPLISASKLTDFEPILKTLPVIDNEDELWKTVRSHYTLKDEYVNLESGYYNIIPNTILEHFINHVKHVNIEGSFYMRNDLNKNKDRVTSELANIISVKYSFN
tara:strand:+ start:5770 stop:6123 length:354 start_codon:yes stop_codon:yes gene_type:complete